MRVKEKCKSCGKKHLQNDYNKLSCNGAYYVDLEGWATAKRKWWLARLKFKKRGGKNA